MLFRWILEDQASCGVHGDLVELGVYKGKSAILMGEYLRPGEGFVVVDLFDSNPDDDADLSEVRESYPQLQREDFERNYRRFHSQLPTVVQGYSSEVVNHASPGRCRFVHVDASHLYKHVREDVAAAQTLLTAGGVVVFDDFRSIHTPGVAAAVWEAVVNDGLRVVAVTAHKLYGMWGDPTAVQDRLLDRLANLRRWNGDVQDVVGARLIRLAEIARTRRVLEAVLPSTTVHAIARMYERVRFA